MVKPLKITIVKLLITLLNLGMLALSCIYFKDLPRVVLLCSVILFAALGVAVPSINEQVHESIYKFFILLSVFAAFILLCYVVLDACGLLTKFKDLETLLQFVRKTKQWGILVYIGLVIFQVIFLPVPSAIVAVLGTVLYGPTYAFIFMTIGTITGSVLTFLLGRMFGRKLAVWVIGEEKTDKFSELINEKGKFLFVVMLLFPFFPDDVICLIAGITTMSFGFFILAVTLARPVMIAFMCYFGSGTIIPFKGWGIPVWIAIIAAIIILFFVVNKIKKKLIDKKDCKTQKK